MGVDYFAARAKGERLARLYAGPWPENYGRVPRGHQTRSAKITPRQLPAGLSDDARDDRLAATKMRL
jgi:hypothetical protein